MPVGDGLAMPVDDGLKTFSPSGSCARRPRHELKSRKMLRASTGLLAFRDEDVRAFRGLRHRIHHVGAEFFRHVLIEARCSAKEVPWLSESVDGGAPVVPFRVATIAYVQSAFGAQPLHDIGIRFNDENVPDTARVAEGCAIPPISARQQSGSPCLSPSLRRPRVVQQLESADMRSIQSRERLMSTSRL